MQNPEINFAVSFSDTTYKLITKLDKKSYFRFALDGVDASNFLIVELLQQLDLG